MRIGDAQMLAFDLEPVAPSWERRAPGDQGPWAQLSIWISGKNICQNWLASTQEVHRGVFVPLAPIADWLVRNARHIAYEESARPFPTDINLPEALRLWKIAAPAAPFDEDQWDDLRFAWSDRHFLLAGADGCWLPDLSLVKVDEILWASASLPEFATPGAREVSIASSCATFRPA